MRPLTEGSISKEGFAYTAQHLLSRTSKFKEHRVKIVVKDEEAYHAASSLEKIEDGSFRYVNSNTDSGSSTKRSIRNNSVFSADSNERDEPIILGFQPTEAHLAKEASCKDRKSQGSVEKSLLQRKVTFMKEEGSLAGIKTLQGPVDNRSALPKLWRDMPVLKKDTSRGASTESNSGESLPSLPPEAAKSKSKFGIAIPYDFSAFPPTAQPSNPLHKNKEDGIGGRSQAQLLENAPASALFQPFRITRMAVIDEEGANEIKKDLKDRLHKIIDRVYNNILQDACTSEDPLVRLLLASLSEVDLMKKDLEDLKGCSNLWWMRAIYWCLPSTLPSSRKDGWHPKQNSDTLSTLLGDLQRWDSSFTSQRCYRLARIEPWTWSSDSLLPPETQGTVKERVDTEINSNNEAYDMDYQLMGKRCFADWKAGAGRAKDWRQCAYAKVATKRQRLVSINSKKNKDAASGKLKSAYPCFHSLLGLGMLNAALNCRQKTLIMSTNPAITYISVSSIAERSSRSTERMYKRILTEDNPVARDKALKAGKNGYGPL